MKWIKRMFQKRNKNKREYHCLFLNEIEYQRMLKLGSKQATIHIGNGIGAAITCIDKHGKTHDITDYSTW